LKNYLLLIALFIAACGPAQGDTTITISWTLPDVYCDGSVLVPADLTTTEVYVSANPIAASDDGSCGGVRDVPPAGITPLSVPASVFSVSATLTPGVTYHMRARIQATNGEWSNFSSELVKVVEDLQPGILQNFSFN
jgi:hypothetical protein